ncbi:hypothetical protein RJT34_01470 [Clitoria ternatea]|uniref:Uncharacterized protein n=1 Tax=Clitoria ternatea TaxID=43366 RepID=A0AAN9KGA0_CLITE
MCVPPSLPSPMCPPSPTSMNRGVLSGYHHIKVQLKALTILVRRDHPTPPTRRSISLEVGLEEWCSLSRGGVV